MNKFLLPALGLTFLAGCQTVNATKKNPTYHKDIEPLINRECVQCHTTGSIAPFTLLNYADAFENGAEIQVQTEERLMPPWHIQDDGGCQDFKDSRLLTADEIDTIRVWFDNGMPEGNPADAPPPPPPPPTIDRIDANLDMNIDYLPDDAITDDYRCFLVDPGLVADKFMTAYEVLPGSPEIVHHIILFSITDAAAQTEAESLDGADGRPGYTCFGDARVNALPVVAWAPGINFQELPPNTGAKLTAGRKLVMQVHYNTQAIKPGQELPTDRTVINLKLEDSVPNPALLTLLPVDFSLEPGQPEVIVDSGFISLDQLPFSVSLEGVLPHMHLRGQTLRFEVKHEDGSVECLNNVSQWDFHWQQTYFYEAPVIIKPTDSLRLRCTFNTSDDTEPVVFGEGTEDEMCLMGTYITSPLFNVVTP
jgi:hypothetical protein